MMDWERCQTRHMSPGIRPWRCERSIAYVATQDGFGQEAARRIDPYGASDWDAIGLCKDCAHDLLRREQRRDRRGVPRLYTLYRIIACKVTVGVEEQMLRSVLPGSRGMR